MSAIILPQGLRSCTQSRAPHSLHPSYPLALGWSRSNMSGSHSMLGLTHPTLPLKSVRVSGGYSKLQCGCAILSTGLNSTDQGDQRCEQQTPTPVWGLFVGSGTLQCSRRGTPQLHRPGSQQSDWPSLPLTINCSSSDL